MLENDIQQVCMNGHQITDCFNQFPESRRNFCPKCGKPTITQCQSCNAHIPGHDYLTIYPESVPNFCGNCGEPYPWTKIKIENSQELIEELGELSPEDKLILKTSLDELIRESPKAEVALLRFKKIATKLGKESYELFKKVISDIVSETIRKSLFGK